MIHLAGPPAGAAQTAAAYPAPAGSLASRHGIPDDQERCLAALSRALSDELSADGLLVSWHSVQEEPVVLFSAGACSDSAPGQRGALELASGLVENAAALSRPVMASGCSDRGLLRALVIPLADGAAAVTGLFDRANPAEPSAGPSIQRALPMLQPFFRLWAASRRVSAGFLGLTAALDNCDIATFLLGRGGEVLFANQAGERLFAGRDGIDRKAGRLSGATLPDTLRLQAAIEHVLFSSDIGQPNPVVAMRRGRRRPLMVSLVRAELPAASLREVAVAHVFDPEQDLSQVMQPACRFYGLSASETRLTCKLAAGATLADAAKAVGVREQTARSCLKQIFLKTETNRQAELVWLMLKSAVRVANAGRTQVF